MLLVGSAFILALPIAHWVTRTGSSAKCLISKMEVCSFEHSLWHSSVIGSHELDHSRWCQPCLLTARRTSADLIWHTCSSPRVISTSNGVVFLGQTRRGIKNGWMSCQVLSCRSRHGLRSKSARTKKVINGQRRGCQELQQIIRNNLRTCAIILHWCSHYMANMSCLLTSDHSGNMFMALPRATRNN